MPDLALGTWAFTFGPFEAHPWPLERVLRYAAAAGYGGVELNGFRPHPHPDDYDTPDKCRSLAAQIASYGMGISGYAPDFSAAPPAEGEPGNYLGLFRKALAFCERCGIATLRVDSVSRPVPLPPEVYEQRFARLVSTWRAAAREALAAGITVVWEFEPGFWLNKPGEVLRLVDAVAETNFRILFDTSHAYMGAVVGARHTGDREVLGGGVAEYAERLLPHIGHLHLIDSDGTLHDGETSTHAPFGEGRIDFGRALAALRPAVVSLPWWCVDLCFNSDAEPAGRGAVPFVRQLLKEAQ